MKQLDQYWKSSIFKIGSEPAKGTSLDDGDEYQYTHTHACTHTHKHTVCAADKHSHFKESYAPHLGNPHWKCADCAQYWINEYTVLQTHPHTKTNIYTQHLMRNTTAL